MPTIFPGGNQGMADLTLATGWHTIAHNRYRGNTVALREQAKRGAGVMLLMHPCELCVRGLFYPRYWSDNTDYATQNGGKWNFVVERDNQLAIPVDEDFWEYLFQTSRRWGLNVRVAVVCQLCVCVRAAPPSPDCPLWSQSRCTNKTGCTTSLSG